MVEHEFEVDRGSVVDGKPTWPDVLMLTMSKRQALDLIGQLARIINDSDAVAIQFVGTMTNASNEGPALATVPLG